MLSECYFALFGIIDGIIPADAVKPADKRLKGDASSSLSEKKVATKSGKTLNMDMLRVFFERSEEDTSVYFRDKKIWECGKEYQEYCNCAKTDKR